MRTGRLKIVAFILMFAFVSLIITMPAKAGVVDNESVPIDLTVFIHCANGGAGDIVTLSGNLHVLISVNISNSGNINLDEHFQPQGISGISASGDKYQGTGVTQTHETINSAGFPLTFTGINNFRMIGQGSGNNFRVHSVSHITINANGDVTAFVDNLSVDCS